MEKSPGEETTDTQAEADVDVKLLKEPEEADSAADKDTPQNPDVPVPGSSDPATQSNEATGVRQPEERKEPEEPDINFVTENGTQLRCGLDPSTAEHVLQGSEPMETSVSDQAEHLKSRPVAENLQLEPETHSGTEKSRDIELATAEALTRLHESMGMSMSDQVGLLKSQSEMDKPVGKNPQQEAKTYSGAEKSRDVELAAAEALSQLSEPMETSVSDQDGLLMSRSNTNEMVDDKLPHQCEKPQEPERNRATEATGPQSHGVLSVLNTAESKNPNILEEQQKPEAPETNSATENDAAPSHNDGTAEDNPQVNEPMDIRISDEEGELHSTSGTKAVGKVSLLCGGGGSLALLSMQYRDDSSEDDLSESDSDSDSSSSTSSSSSSSSSGVISSVMNELEQEEGQEDAPAPGRRPLPLKTQDELLIEDLPAVENLSVSLPQDTEMETIGLISSIVDQLVIVESKKNLQPVKDDSVLFSKERVAIGKVFEVFGPVCQPYYILRFNSKEEIEQKNLRTGEPVFFAPKLKDLTDYIFAEQLDKIKGSDASWKNDQEPPLEALDFSDDEQEKLAKQKLKERKRQQRQQQNQEESDSENEMPTCRPRKPPRRRPQDGDAQSDRPVYHSPHSGFHSNYHANPHFQAQGGSPRLQPQGGSPRLQPQGGSPRLQPQDNPRFQPRGSPRFHPQGSPHFQPDYRFPPPNPLHPPFQGPRFAPYPGPPPPHIGMGPWGPGPYPGMFHLPPPPPPPPPPPSV